jgi:DNA polymerase I
MRLLVFDIEADNLLLDASRIWCVVTKDLGTGEITKFTEENLHEVIPHLQTADRLIAHNGVCYDVPVLRRLLGGELPPCIDTLLISRLLYPDSKDHPIGGNSLSAWGEFLKCPKGDYKDFSKFTPEMLDYCVQDVEVTAKIYRYLLPKAKEVAEAVKLEHRVGAIITEQIQNGFCLHEENHSNLLRTLRVDRAGLLDDLGNIPPFVYEKVMKKRWWVDPFGNKYATKKEAPLDMVKHLTQGDPIIKTVETPFNHQSGAHIARLFMGRDGWVPAKRTPTGKPDTSRAVLRTLPYPEAMTLTKLSQVDKVLGTYAEAWEKHRRDGRIHGDVITNGAVTGRMTHSNPNLNVPKVVSKKDENGDSHTVWGADGKYGADCRSCFRARDGWVLVGCDASGLEARMLAHYASRWDGGAFGQLILERDIHTVNLELAGLESRDAAKTFYYKFVYGGETDPEHERKLYAACPALRELKRWCIGEAKANERIVGLDGRVLPVRKKKVWPYKRGADGHRVKRTQQEIDNKAYGISVNTLLQSAGAIVMKQALVFFYDTVTERYGLHGHRWALCANVHDEFQTECEPEIAKDVGRIAMDSIRRAGEHFKLAIRLDGESKIGRTWYETH